MISFLRRPGRRVVITRRIAESAEIADMAIVQLSILHAKRDKDVPGRVAKNCGPGKTRAHERITLLSVKTRLDVFVSFRHALRVRPIPL